MSLVSFPFHDLHSEIIISPSFFSLPKDNPSYLKRVIVNNETPPLEVYEALGDGLCGNSPVPCVNDAKRLKRMKNAD